MTPEQRAEFEALNATASTGGMSDAQRAEFDSINTPVEQTFGMQAGDVARSAGEGVQNMAEFAMDVAATPLTLPQRMAKGYANMLFGDEGGLMGRYFEGFTEPPTVGGVPVGDITHATVFPSGDELTDPDYQASAEPEYNIPESQVGPGLRRWKKGAKLGSEFVAGLPLGPSKYIKPALLPAVTGTAGGVVGSELGGDTGEIVGIITGALAGDKASYAKIAKSISDSVGKVGKEGAKRFKRTLAQHTGGDTVVDTSVSLTDEKRALAELLRNAYPEGDAKQLDTMTEYLYPRVKEAMGGMGPTKPGANLGTMAQILDDRGLAAMEKKATKGPAAIQDIQSQLEASNAKVTEFAMKPLQETAATGVTANAAKLPRAQAQAIAAADRANAAQVLEKGQKPFAGTTGIADESAGLAQTLGKKRDEVKALAGKMFDDLPVGERGVSSKSVQKRYKEFFKSKVDKKIFEKRFPSTSGLINGLPDGRVSIDNISDILSEFSQETVGKGIDPKFITGVQDALFSSLDDVVEGASAARKAASANYKAYMQQYGPKSPLGKALAGDAETVGQKLLPSKNTGVARLKDLMETGDAASVQKAEDYLRTVFREEVLNKPNVTPAQIATFKRNYGQTLDMLPEGSTLKADIDKAGNAFGYAEKAEKGAQATEKSLAAKLGKSDDTAEQVVKNLGKVLNSEGSRTKKLSELFTATVNNPQAREDFRRAALDELMTRVTPKGGPTIDSLKKFTAERKLYEDAGVFTAKELDNIENGLGVGQKLFTGKNRAELAKLPDVKARIAETTARVIGAKAGAKTMGSPLIGANIGGELSRNLLRELTTEKANKIAYEMSVNPEKFVEVFERFKKTSMSDAEIRAAWKQLFNVGLSATKPIAAEANVEE